MARGGLGWLVVMFLLLQAAKGGAPSVPDSTMAIGWVWPLPRLASLGANGMPVTSSGWGSMRDVGTPQEHMHVGIDVMYRRAVRVPGAYPLADHGSHDFELPEGTQALAARAGTVVDVATTAKGTHVILDHGNGLRTFYQHLATAYVDEGDRVALGEPLGEAGFDPSGHDKIRHVHFEIRVNGKQVNPEPYTSSWAIVDG